MDKRPFPNIKEGFFLSSRRCNERIYTYLLLKSKYNAELKENHRYLEKMTNKKIAEDLDMDAHTVGKAMKELKSLGYVIQDGKYYKVPKGDFYSLIPTDTLDFLLYYIPKKEKIIKLYIVLYDLFNQNEIFSITRLHHELGYELDKYGKPQSRNSMNIREMLLILSGAQLIDYTIVEGRNEKGAAIDMYKIKFVRSELPEFYRASYKRLVENGEITPDWEALIQKAID